MSSYNNYAKLIEKIDKKSKVISFRLRIMKMDRKKKEKTLLTPTIVHPNQQASIKHLIV
jgi:hypothetical protein